MQQQPVNTSSGKLILLIKSAYWIALLIIAAMAMASLHSAAADDGGAAARRGAADAGQHAESACRSASCSWPARPPTPPRKDSSRWSPRSGRPTAEFETNYDLLLERTGADPLSPARLDPKSVESVLFAKPYHLDYFSIEARGQRLALHLGARNRAWHEQAAPAISPARNGRCSTRPSPRRRSKGSPRSAVASMRFANARLDKHAQPAPDAVLRHHRHHHPGRAVHLPADVGRHPAQDARTGGCAQFDGLHRRA